MSLILATGSNLGDKFNNLCLAKVEICQYFDLVAESRIYVSEPVDYFEQPDFMNQVLEFKIPSLSPHEILKRTLEIENKFGRIRDQARGPRIIDIDILFIGSYSCSDQVLCVPHPRWTERSFVVLPLKELPFYQKLKDQFKIPTEFSHQSFPYRPI